MGLSNCSRCGRVFNKLTRNVCPACVEEENKMFKIVSDYVRVYPQADSAEISEATGVDETIIIQFVKENRLKLISVADSGMMKCEVCGRKVTTGRLCQQCRTRLSDSVQETAERAKKDFEEQQKKRQEIKDMMGNVEKLRHDYIKDKYKK